MQNNQFDQSVLPQNFGSLGFYISALVISGTLFLIGFLMGGVFRGGETAEVVFFLGIIIMLIALINFLVLLFRVWRFTIDQSRHHNFTPSIDTPGKAVGFLFIPIYNLYWAFQVIGKLPVNLNAVADVKGSSQRVSEGLGKALTVLMVIGVIPFVGYLTTITSIYILEPIFIRRSISMCQDLSNPASR